MKFTAPFVTVPYVLVRDAARTKPRSRREASPRGEVGKAPASVRRLARPAARLVLLVRRLAAWRSLAGLSSKTRSRTILLYDYGHLRGPRRASSMVSGTSEA